MSTSPYPVGYGRPPEQTRFRKGQSGNPSGKPGPKKRLKCQFDAALSGALGSTRQALRDGRPPTVIEALARKIALDALDGRSSAQRLVLTILDGGDRGADEDSSAADEEGRRATGVLRQAQEEDKQEEEEEEEEEEKGEEDGFVVDAGEHLRQRFGDRYDVFKARIEKAVEANDLDALAEIAAEMDG